MLDGGSSEIRAYDAGGTIVKRFGGPGDGPGEFRAPTDLFLTTGDTLVVWDQRHQRVTRFDENRVLADVLRLDTEESTPALQLVGVLGAGKLIARVNEPIMPSEGDTWNRTVSRFRYAIHDGTGRLNAMTESRDGRPVYFEVGEDGRVRVDDGGSLWLRAYTIDPESETTWAVVNPDGVVAARVSLPAGFELHDVNAGRVVGVFTDDLGVEFVHIYGVT